MRLKLMTGNMIVLLLVGLVSYLLVKREIEQTLASEIDGRIHDDATLLSQSWKLAGTELSQHVQNRARTSSVRQAMVAVGSEEKRRTRAFEVAEGIAKWFSNPARLSEKPQIVALIDETGRVLARNSDRNRMFGQSLLQKVSALQGALNTGETSYGVWKRNETLLRIAVAPVRSSQGATVGALLVGYDISNGFAKREAKRIGRDVIFVSDAGVYSTSTSVSVKDSLQKHLFGALEGATRAALNGRTSSPWTTEINGDEYVGVIGALPNTHKSKAAFAVIANKTKRLALSSVADVIPLLTLLGLLGLGVYSFIVANSLIKPLETIEEALLSVINGRTDVRVDVQSEEFGGLAYRINQLINLFTGVAEEDEKGRAVTSSGAWVAESMPTTHDLEAPSMDTPLLPQTMADPDADRLAAEPQGAYYARLYKEYVAAKRAAGEDVSNISKDRFIQRLKGNEGHLIKTHNAKMVRFKVVQDHGQVNLEPVIIK